MVLEKGNLFSPVEVKDLIDRVSGKSSLIRLSKQVAIPFNGRKEFVFTMDSEVDVVGESGKKSHGGVSIAPVTMVPIKIEYGARVSDEFMIADEETRLGLLESFNDGFAKKVARGLDLMAFHGVNPRTGAKSSIIGVNNFDDAVTQKVEGALGLATPNEYVETAVGLVEGSEFGQVTGMAMSPAFRTALSSQKDLQGNQMFPELAWGNAPQTIKGLETDVNRTVSDMSGEERDRAIVGDFAEAFKWGFAKEIPLEVIKYGDPDNSGLDLKGYNQIYLRSEMFLGWGVMDANSFARITEALA
ncbi:phage major capsid protein [Jeotgalibaca porci]|uniref:phage major capsid family protein n=1 Tax=Jeotgalibaca porci TaxID=1868793 RepID=UPI0035A0870F